MASIGILQVFNDHTDGLGPSFQNDAERIVALCRLINHQHTFAIYNIGAGQYPTEIESHFGYIISGSPASVNSRHIFTEWLEAFIIGCDKQRKKMLGICFGHQVIAKALGGTVGSLAVPWNLGVRRSSMHQYLPFMQPKRDLLSYAMHNEEVKILPAGFVNLGEVENCRYAFLSKAGHIFSTQLHPEITDQFFSVLLENDAELRKFAQANEAGWINPEVFSSWLDGFFATQTGG